MSVRSESVVGIDVSSLMAMQSTSYMLILSFCTGYINPILDRLGNLHNFTVESQVQFYAPLAFSAVQTEDYYGITPADLSVFVNSAEWTLCKPTFL